MDNERTGGKTGPHRSVNPQSSDSAESRSTVWIRSKTATVKIVDGTPQADIDRMVEQALDAAERLSATARSGEAASTIDRIAELLTTAGPLTGRDIADRLAERVDTVRKALARDSGKRFSMHAAIEGPATWTVREDVAMRYLDIVADA